MEANAIRAQLRAMACGELGSVSPDAAPYSPSWVEAYIEASNTDGPAARRALRAERRREVELTDRPARIRVECWRERDLPGVSIAGDPIGGEPADWAEVYGWRAALAAARIMRAWHREEWRYRRMLLQIRDPRLDDAIDAALYGRER